MLSNKEVPIMNSASPAHVRALLLALLAESGEISIPDLHVLMFALGRVAEQPSPYLGFTFLMDLQGPYSPELKELLVSMRQEGLIDQKGTGKDAVLRLAPVGRMFGERYNRLFPSLKDVARIAISNMGQTITRVRRLNSSTPPGRVVVWCQEGFTETRELSIR